MSAADILPPNTRSLYPFEGRTLDLDAGHRMHFLDEGAGQPLLMLHGNPTWSFYYRNLVLGLRGQYRCIVPDHVGCGLSDKPADWSYTILDHTTNVCELIQNLNLNNITLVVHDWGGIIGYLAALRLPERFHRFVVFNTAVSLLRLPRWLLLMRNRLIGPLAIQGMNLMVRGAFRMARGGSGRYPKEVRDGYLAPYRTWSSRIAIRRFVQEIPMEDGHPNVRLIDELRRDIQVVTDRPHLVVWGMRDPVFHHGYLEAWRELVPGADFHCMEDAGHWVVEDEHGRILPLMSNFLSRTA